VLLAGVKDTCKSWLAAYLAVCVSLGKPCFGRPVKQGKVVYVYGEGAMKKRLKLLSKAMGCENNPNLFPYPLRADLATPAAQEDFCHHIPPETTLIVLDNYEKYWASDLDEKIVAAAMRFVTRIREYATVLLAQHEVKNQRKNAAKHALAKGLSNIVNAADGTLSLQKDKQGVVTCQVYHRESEPPDHPLKFRLMKLGDGSFTLKLISESSADSALSLVDEKSTGCLSKIRSILKATMREPLSRSAIYANHLKGQGLKGLSTSAFYDSYFPALVTEGFLEEVEEGSGNYRLTG